MDYFEKYAIIIQHVCSKTTPGKKMLQKLLYLMERNGVDLNLNYSIHFFGPYSSKLDNSMQALEINDYIDIDTSGNTHLIHLGEKHIDDMPLEASEQEKIDFILDNFINKTPLALEAITTLDYAANSLLNGKYTDEEVIAKVKQIKGTKFSERDLKEDLKILKDFGFLQ